MTTNPAIWLAALMSLGLYSYLWKENPFFRVCEHAYLGLSLSHLVVMGWNNVRDMGLSKLAQGQYAVLVPIILGVLLFTRWSPKVSWLSRYPVAFMVGVASGVTITGIPEAGIIAQIRAAMGPLNSLQSVLMLLFNISAVSVFLFVLGSKTEANRVIGGGMLGTIVSYGNAIGRFVLMISFGAVFGTTVMARLGLFIPRLELLFRDWIHLIPAAK